MKTKCDPRRTLCLFAAAILVSLFSACAERLPNSIRYNLRPSHGSTISAADRLTAAKVLDAITSGYGMKEVPHGPENVIRIYAESPGLGFLMYAEDQTNHIAVCITGVRARMEATRERLRFIEELEQALQQEFGALGSGH